MKFAQAIAIDQLIENLPDYYTTFDRDLVQRAYNVAAEAHSEQKRQSGEPYINHCVAVAAILSEMKMPAEVIAAGLLHDTVEDTSVKLEEIHKKFGGTVANLVDGVTKLESLPRVSHRDDQDGSKDRRAGEQHSASEQDSRRKRQATIETMRKTFLAMNDDVRVVLIKLADRLHNMRTLGFTPPEKQKRIAQETLDIYAPLANRLGIWQIKW